ncbi:MAG: TetR/AcrR family transcriptional regulator [Anaerolineaceae bacterium]
MINNRATILETGLAFFAAFGYETSGTLEICDAAGVSKPTMYHYFKSKQGLMDAILAENFEPFLERLKETSRASGMSYTPLKIEKPERGAIRECQKSKFY